MLSIIPKPKVCIERKGAFTLPDDVVVKSDFDLPLLQAQTGESSYFVIKKDENISSEGYILLVSENGIEISASTKTGAYYALQTIRKIGRTDLGSRKIPCCDIKDEPKFGWRGVHLDVARHFFGVYEVKRFLDLLFAEKINVFHWHLTDDQGWRIEIKKYPLLTEIGAKRKYSQTGGWRTTKIDNVPYEGYFTQEQIKDVVAYAKERGITVVPEIDFPAHCAAAMAAYKHLACREIDTEVPGYYGGLYPERVEHNKRWNRTVCCGKESTFEFIFNVLDEVCEMFDSPYIHMGGDEAPKDEWKDCPACQKVMKDNGLADEVQLQGWFENRISAYLKEKGRKLIGWNEVLESDNLNTQDKNIVVQYWTPKRDKNAEKYVNDGGSMIMSNHQSFYFDMTYSQYPLKNTYNYNPEKFGVNKENVTNVLGVEGELWSEFIRDREKLDMQAFPRIQALAENAWTAQEALDWDDFKNRLDDYKDVLDALNVNYAVDSVALPKNVFLRTKAQLQFLGSNPYFEVELNRKYKAKGER